MHACGDRVRPVRAKARQASAVKQEIPTRECGIPPPLGGRGCQEQHDTRLDCQRGYAFPHKSW